MTQKLRLIVNRNKPFFDADFFECVKAREAGTREQRRRAQEILARYAVKFSEFLKTDSFLGKEIQGVYTIGPEIHKIMVMNFLTEFSLFD